MVFSYSFHFINSIFKTYSITIHCCEKKNSVQTSFVVVNALTLLYAIKSKYVVFSQQIFIF